MPRKTDSKNPADWLLMAQSDLELIRLAAEKEIGFTAARSKLAEVLEKVLKAELIRLGWVLEKTHELDHLLDELVARRSDLESAAEPLCDTLADVYFTDRYPGFDLDPRCQRSTRQARQRTQAGGRVGEAAILCWHDQ